MPVQLLKIKLGRQQGTLILQSKPMLYEVSTRATTTVFQKQGTVYQSNVAQFHCHFCE